MTVKQKKSKSDKRIQNRPRMIRDSFTMPEVDYLRIKALKTRILAGGQEIKKSEVLRAGLLALEAMSDKQLHNIAEQVERIKTGRPSGKVNK